MIEQQFITKKYVEVGKKKNKMVWTLDIGVGERPRGIINIDVIRTPYCNIVADATNLPFKSCVFSRIWCSQVLEHLDNPRKAIKEINRVLNSKDVAIIDFPKVEFTNLMIHRFIELFLNFPFSLRPKWLTLLFKSIVGHRRQNPRYYHKHIITAQLVSEELEIIEAGEIGDIFFAILTHGKKAKWFKNKPKLNTAMLVKCTKA
jgi:ubiquinone/menaquinone biosynthesis C-methylase UbiE